VNRAYATAAAVILATLVVVQWALIRLDPLLLTVIGIAAGILAMVAVFEQMLEDIARKDGVEALVDLAHSDPMAFGRLVADEYLHLLEHAEGDTLAEAERSAVYLADSLEENARRIRIERYEELLQSRVFVP
jgi:hypothetical protein